MLEDCEGWGTMGEAKRQAVTIGSARKPAFGGAGWGGGAVWMAIAALCVITLSATLDTDDLAAGRTAIDGMLRAAGLAPASSPEIERLTARLAAENDDLRNRVATLESMMSGPTGAVHPASATPSETVPATDEALSKSRFGVDLGPIVSLDAATDQWRMLAAQHRAVAELVPTAALEERIDGGLELRLLAGPFDNAGDAAILCARMDAAGTACRTTPYSGRRLVMP